MNKPELEELKKLKGYSIYPKTMLYDDGMNKKDIIDLLSKENDDLKIECHIDIMPYTDFKGECLRPDKKSEYLFTIKFSVFR